MPPSLKSEGTTGPSGSAAYGISAATASYIR